MKTLVVDKEDKHNLNILEGMKPLHTKFDEIIPNELLGGLPSMRDIKHQIDLISELAYQIHHITKWVKKKGEIFWEKVKKLLRKKYIYESLSSCFVPALLTLKKDWR